MMTETRAFTTYSLPVPKKHTDTHKGQVVLDSYRLVHKYSQEDLSLVERLSKRLSEENLVSAVTSKDYQDWHDRLADGDESLDSIITSIKHKGWYT